ncbi:MAG: hypothetical protein ABW043_16875 [Devosia sp.]|uniref:hypothetical protein n=1 Tax=Devosia sp. TaxID=1871048 RepID=UPI003391025B
MNRLLLLAPLALSACDQTPLERAMASGKVALAAQAPDGTKLWAVVPKGEDHRIYFASTGAFGRQRKSLDCGPGCKPFVGDDVPTAQVRP